MTVGVAHDALRQGLPEHVIMCPVHARTNDPYDVLVIGARSLRRVHRVLARAARSPGPRGREEAVPAREDVRRRPHAAGRATALRHGSGRAPRRLPTLRRIAVDRARRDPRARLARASRLPAATDIVVRRRELDEMVAAQAVKAGAVVWQGAEAIAPVVDGGLLAGATVRRTRTRAPPKRYGRAISWSPTGPTRASGARSALPVTAPSHWAWRSAGYFTSPHHDEPWIESHLDIRDQDRAITLPGYGWIFPAGDGTVNVGVGLLSTFHGWRHVNTTHLMEAFCETAPARWGISAATATCAPTGGRLPTGGSVTPRTGPNFLVAGDAAGIREPVQRRGDLGRLRDRGGSRPTRSISRSPRATVSRSRPTTSGSPRSTASISRSPGPSCGPSATPP